MPAKTSSDYQLKMAKGSTIKQLKNEFELFQRHYDVFHAIYERGPIGMLKLSRRVPISYAKIRYSLSLLEQEQIVRATTKGAAVNPAKVRPYLDELQATLSYLSTELMHMLKEIEDMKKSAVKEP